MSTAWHADEVSKVGPGLFSGSRDHTLRRVAETCPGSTLWNHHIRGRTAVPHAETHFCRICPHYQEYRSYRPIHLDCWKVSLVTCCFPRHTHHRRRYSADIMPSATITRLTISFTLTDPSRRSSELPVTSNQPFTPTTPNTDTRSTML
jgi:hypothetical protein